MTVVSSAIEEAAVALGDGEVFAGGVGAATVEVFLLQPAQARKLFRLLPFFWLPIPLAFSLLLP